MLLYHFESHPFDSPEVKGTSVANGKPAVKGHQAVTGSDVPVKDRVIDVRFRLGGAQPVTAEFDERVFTGSHCGC